MTKTSLRSALGNVRGLGSAKAGTAHWWVMRLTSLALIVLCGWFVVKLLFCLSSNDYEATVVWVRHPVNAVLMCLLLAVGFHHAANGLQTVIEDYFHCACIKHSSIVAVKFLSILLAGIGVVAVGQIAFGG